MKINAFDPFRAGKKLSLERVLSAKLGAHDGNESYDDCVSGPCRGSKSSHTFTSNRMAIE